MPRNSHMIAAIGSALSAMLLLALSVPAGAAAREACQAAIASDLQASVSAQLCAEQAIELRSPR